MKMQIREDYFGKKCESGIIYRSFFESIKGLTKEEQADIWNAIFELMFNDKEIELAGIIKSIFILIKPQILKQKKFNKNKKG